MSPTTRERILDVASELFVEQGYDGTSLREIAERLGFTKAALYYHFPSKDEILRALLEPFDELIDELLGRLEAPTTSRSGPTRWSGSSTRCSTTSTSSGWSSATATPSR